MKKYWTMITKDYINHWSVTNAVREYISNSLDSPAPFEYEIGEDFIILTSVGITLPATIFALGYSKNRQDEEAVGQFGEGALVSMVPLLREEKGLHFVNGNVIWKPAFEYNESLEIEVLVINEEENTCPTENYSVIIDNLTPDEIEEIRSICIYFRDDLGEVLESTRGQVIKGIAGKLFVGGIYVTEIPKYIQSYNFKSKYLPLNRDRKSVDTWDLSVQVQALLDEVETPENIAKMIVAKSPDIYCSKFGTTTAVANSVYDEFSSKNGLGVVANDHYEKQRLEKEGYKDIIVIGDEATTKAIQKAPAYKEYLESLELEEIEQEKSPIELLEEFLDKHDLFGAESDLNDIIDLFKSKGVQWQ